MRDQVMCDLLHLFNVTLRAYKPLQAAKGSLNRNSSACACAPGQPCSCRPAAALKLSHLQADAQVGAPHIPLMPACPWLRTGTFSPNGAAH